MRIEKSQIKKSIIKAWNYLTSFNIFKIGMNYHPTNYFFRIKYPESERLGRTGIIAQILDACVSLEECCIVSVQDKKYEFIKFLTRRQREDGLWAFDDFRYSIDADTSLIVSISLLRAGVKIKSFTSTQSTITQNFKTGHAFRSFQFCPYQHSNFNIHIEVTSNALYFLKLVGGISRKEVKETEEWLKKNQHKDGYWESYWYPSIYLGTFRAIRAIGTNCETASKALKFLESNQNSPAPNFNGGY